MELNSLAIKLLLNPECFPTHRIYDLLKASFIKVCELWLVTLKEFDIGILQHSVTEEQETTLSSSRWFGL